MDMSAYEKYVVLPLKIEEEKNYLHIMNCCLNVCNDV